MKWCDYVKIFGKCPKRNKENSIPIEEPSNEPEDESSDEFEIISNEEEHKEEAKDEVKETAEEAKADETQKVEEPPTNNTPEEDS